MGAFLVLYDVYLISEISRYNPRLFASLLGLLRHLQHGYLT